MDLKNSQIVVNDVLEELNEENKRLFNELLFADKCLKILIEFKSFVELNSNQFKLNLDENNKQLYEELSEKVKQVLDEKRLSAKNDIEAKKEENSFNDNSESGQQFGNDIEFNDPKEMIDKCKPEANQWVCPYPRCDRTYTKVLTMKMHVRYDHSDTWYTCEWPGCDYKSKHKDVITKHRTTHSKEYGVSCVWPNCHKKFKTKTDMNHHLLVHKQVKTQSRDSPRFQYRCITGGNLRIHNLAAERLKMNQNLMIMSEEVTPNGESQSPMSSDMNRHKRINTIL